MIGIMIPMPCECRDCLLMQYYPFAGLTVCRATGNTLADHFETIKFDGRASDCPLIDLSRYEDDHK